MSFAKQGKNPTVVATRGQTTVGSYDYGLATCAVMSALKTGMVGGAKHGGCNAGELWTQNNETKDLDDESVQHSDAIFSVLAITVYMLVGAVYFIPRFGWSGWEVMYFAFCTITTVGYGDYNGSQDQTTMIFTTLYAFIGKFVVRGFKLLGFTHERCRTTDLLCCCCFAGVGMIGLAVAELMETLDQMKKLAHRKKVQMLSEQLHETRLLQENRNVLVHAHHVEGLKSLVNERLFSKKRAGTRLIRIMFPTLVLALIGSGILMATEEADSDILSNGQPFTTCFYTSVITSLSIGYGDFFPTTDAGRGLFCIFIVSCRALYLHICSWGGGSSELSTQLPSCYAACCMMHVAYMLPAILGGMHAQVTRRGERTGEVLA